MNDNGSVFELRVVLTVDDFDAAVRLYRDVLGLPPDGAFEGGALFAAGKGTIEILTRDAADAVDKLEAGRSLGGPVRIAMEVANSEKSGAAMETAGAVRLGGPVTAPWGHRSVRLKTAEGVQLTLFTTPPPARA